MTVQVCDQVAHARAMRAGGYWQDQTIGPKRLKVVADLPCTPVGKVQRFKLREMLAAGAVRA